VVTDIRPPAAGGALQRPGRRPRQADPWCR